MQIYVVKQGDDVSHIAQTYGTTAQALIKANKLETPSQLVVGQALVIPIIGQFYFVKQGDTLAKISQMFHISVQNLAQINQLSPNETLPQGLRLYIPQQQKTAITTNAYIEPYGSEVSQGLIHAAENRTPYLTYLAPFSYQIQNDGTLKPPPLDNFAQIAADNQAALMLAATNLKNGEFNTELGRTIVTDKTMQTKLLNNLIQTAKDRNYRDVHFDLEYLPPETREDYNSFLRKARDQLHENGLLLSTALAPKTSADQQGIVYGAHDYAAHGEIADYVVLMTYEWGYSYGPPMAVSPINNVRDVVDFALSVMSSDKILLGQNLYGYDWTLPYKAGGEAAKAVSPQQAIQIARKNNVAIDYDQKAQAPFFKYQTDDGDEHEVWFEDARSIQAKFDMIKELNLRGISYWKLGLSFPQNWLLLQGNFNITKL